jgi:hypothetical protein
MGRLLEDLRSLRTNHDDEVGGTAHDEGCRSAQDATVGYRREGLYAHVMALDPSELCQLPLDWCDDRLAGDVGDVLYLISLLARATTGHAATLPSPAMNSRRLIRLPRRRWRATWAGLRSRALWRSLG